MMTMRWSVKRSCAHMPNGRTAEITFDARGRIAAIRSSALATPPITSMTAAVSSAVTTCSTGLLLS
ncbi:hypothetical protein OG762_23315 [Streptomyces sp. NBC_01136]|uniref:hypothetical protein n=1 Tax=unclassified Streptomyces TaxID=2593676 RepID=UPI00324DA44B|nr:hypothetical protein OG762_23315 [Streptomyces sp. NBC_01136]